MAVARAEEKKLEKRGLLEYGHPDLHLGHHGHPLGISYAAPIGHDIGLHSAPVFEKTIGPVAHAAPVLAHSAPVLAHSAPLLSHSAPLLSHSAPLFSHSAPVLAHSAPLLSHSAPVLAHHSAPVLAHHSGPVLAHHSAPVLAHHSAPVLAHSAPALGVAKSYSSLTFGTAPIVDHGPIGYAGPVVAKSYAAPIIAKSYAAPVVAKTYAAPAPIYSGHIGHSFGHESYAAPIVSAPLSFGHHEAYGLNLDAHHHYHH